MHKASLAVLTSIILLGDAWGQTSHAFDQGGTQPLLSLAGKIIGNGAFDDNCQRIGTIDEAVFDEKGDSYELIVDVSSYLGADQKRISLSASEVKLQLNQLDDKCPEHILVLINKDEISQKPPVDTSTNK